VWCFSPQRTDAAERIPFVLLVVFDGTIAASVVNAPAAETGHLASPNMQDGRVCVHRPYSDFPQPVLANRRHEQQNYALADNTEVRPTRVLVAEDDADAREMLVEALREEGYQVIEVENGRQLAKCLVKPYGHTCPRPDVVISDIRMPGHTGLEVLAALRESDWAMPVILVTAFGDEDTHEEARRLGAAEEARRLGAALVVDKPCSVELMVHAVRNTVPPSI
jgi:CheY-like chemotaxis protein